MTKLLITGATGNVGIEVLNALHQTKHALTVYAGVRNIKTDKLKLAAYNCQFVAFDFAKPESYAAALNACSLVFLVRPPELADVETYFKPFIEACKNEKVQHIIFLSVQGVERNKFIPHYKIEQLIAGSQLNYTFLRPAYFMQNFTTTLQNDLVQYNRIYLPAGNAKFTLIDVRDIGKVAAAIVLNPSQHVNISYDLTTSKTLTFGEIASEFSTVLGRYIEFTSPTLLKFFITKKRENTPTIFILIMIMLHYLPRFQQAAPITTCVADLTGEKPLSLKQFISDYRQPLSTLK